MRLDLNVSIIDKENSNIKPPRIDQHFVEYAN